eukprot:TRINITY_DN26213_c0_g1_i1.p1 TRINITY_DN26213_c0_g1~~TRINITY_DN26213_c0_g1_i1.p1  ORF type:complete len:179 (+),score=28.04 TRINITY_DN26213_c0_g1_i1:239-775(+)
METRGIPFVNNQLFRVQPKWNSVCEIPRCGKTLLRLSKQRTPFLYGSLFHTQRVKNAVKAMAEASPKSVPVQDAFELLKAGHRYLDVRTPEEFNAGHVEGAINVPYMLKTEGGMVKNPDFLTQVLSNFSKDEELVVGCQSGRRSLMAAKDLLANEFTKITDVGGGYSAWLQSGLPVKN